MSALKKKETSPEQNRFITLHPPVECLAIAMKSIVFKPQLLMRYFLSIFIILSLFSCNKNNREPEEGQPSQNILSAFAVTVKERVENRAIITWTPSISRDTLHTVYYKTSLNGRLIDSGRLMQIDTLLYLSGDSLYNGKVTAYNRAGDSSVATFVLQPYKGHIYALYNRTLELRDFISFPFYPEWEQYYWKTPFSVFGISQPTVSHDTLFIKPTDRYGGASTDPVYAIDANDGHIIWQSEPNLNFVTPLTYHMGILYGSTGSGVIALDAASGRVLWNNTSVVSQIPYEIGMSTNPVADGQTVFAGDKQTNTADLYGFDRLTGAVKWRFYTSESLPVRPAVAEGKLFYGGAYDTVFAIDENTGKAVWKTNLGDGNHVGGYRSASPVHTGNLIIVSTSYRVAALDTKSGGIVWQASLPGSVYSTPAVGDGTLYIPINVGDISTNDYSYVIIALDIASGATKWMQTTVNPSYIDNLIFAQHKLYCLRGDALYIFDAATGDLQVGLGGVSLYTLKINDTVYYHADHGNY